MTSARAPVLVFHPGTQHSWQTAHALQDLGLLHRYVTSLFHRADHWPYQLERWLPGPLGRRLGAEFGRFAYPALDPARVRTVGLAEWAERAARRGGFPAIARRLDTVGNRAFARALGREIAGREPFALWGYGGSALHAFRAAQARGRLCILDRTIGDGRAWNAILDAEEDRYPAYRMPGGRVPPARIAHDDEEYALADRIVVGGPVAAETVRTHASDPAAAARVRVLPYCFDARLFGALPPPDLRPTGGPLRCLFLGQAGVRKGIHLVLEVFARLPASAATLTIVGDLQVPPATWARHADRVTYRRTVARADVPALMRAHDVLLLPSLFEGSAVSLLEALAAGLGLIQTRAAGLGVTPDTGLLLPDASEVALGAALAEAIRDPARVDDWRHAAQFEARRYTFARYRDGIADLLDDAVSRPIAPPSPAAAPPSPA